jgi:rod shape-determining protein MreB
MFLSAKFSNVIASQLTGVMAFIDFFTMFSSDLAIDFGREAVRVFAKGRGIILDEPSMIIVNKITNVIEALGKEALVNFF